MLCVTVKMTDIDFALLDWLEQVDLNSRFLNTIQKKIVQNTRCVRNSLGLPTKFRSCC